ncbi:hypothetical protein PG997_010615 [Apiospora hydei]|uniref:F-box domain-containing protein n=1 Tax=Apiospora hydei TaxID=1337664 RepID=A0ABR1VGS7_9PEZI
MPNLPDLPRELRDHIYKFCLVDTTGLLRVNKTVHHEANLVFYSQNIFDFSDARPDQVARLLDRIGPAKAAQIRHIIVPFPHLLGVHARPPIRDEAYQDEAVTTALTMVDSHFRDLVPSVREIVVEAYDDSDPDDYVRREMARLGWTVSAEVRSNACGRFLGDGDSDWVPAQNEGRPGFCG